MQCSAWQPAKFHIGTGMKRNPEILRAVMLRAEEQPVGEPLYRVAFEGASQEEIGGHVQLLIDAGLVEGNVIWEKGGMGPPLRYIVKRITSRGYEFLDNARNEDVWTKTLKELTKRGATVSIAVLEELLKECAKKLFLGN